MKHLLHPFFLTCLLLVLLHQALQKIWGIHLGFISNHVDNFLCMPIVLSLWKAERELIFNKGEDYRVSVFEIIAITIYISIIAEIVFPYFSNSFYGDWMDVVFYFSGAGLYWFYSRVYRPACRRQV